MSLRGNTDENRFSADAQKARSLARAARNADLDGVHEYPTLTIFSDNERHSVTATSLPETDADRAKADRLEIARATRTSRGGAPKSPFVPVQVYDQYSNPGGVMTFEQREEAAICSYKARSRADLTPEMLIGEHGEHAYLMLLIATAAKDARVKA